MKRKRLFLNGRTRDGSQLYVTDEKTGEDLVMDKVARPSDWTNKSCVIEDDDSDPHHVYATSLDEFEEEGGNRSSSGAATEAYREGWDRIFGGSSSKAVN